MATKSKRTGGFSPGQWSADFARSDDTSTPPPDANARRLTCTVAGSSPRFVSADGSFAIWGASYEHEGEKFSCTIKGDLARVNPGEMLACEGKWKQHDKHGWAFQVWEYRSSLPDTPSGVALWLERRVDGVGPTFAKAIVDHFGHDKVYEVLDADATQLRQVKTPAGRKLPEKQVEKAIGAWDEAKAIRQIETFLFSHGVTSSLAGKLYRQYGPEVVDVLSKTPYRITEMRGIGFKVADKVAVSMGTALNDPYRIMCAILFVLDEAEGQGHTFLALQQMVSHTTEALKPPGSTKNDPPPQEVRDPTLIVECASKLSGASRIVVEEDEHLQQRVYSKRMHKLETQLAQRIRHLLSTPGEPLFKKPEMPTPPKDATPEQVEKLRLPTEEQWGAVESVRTQRLAMLTGGPGVGKCVRGDTPVFINGVYIRADEAWERFAVDLEWDEDGNWARPSGALTTNSLDGAGRIVEMPVTALWKQRVREMGRKVVLDDGSELVMTKKHRLHGPDGWTNEFQVGDRVCLPRTVKWTGERVDPDLATLLAWQLSEGHEYSYRRGEGRAGVGRDALRITQADRAVLDRVRESAGSFAARAGIRMGSMPIYTSKDKAAALSIHSADYRRYLEDRGYEWGNLSATKRVPDFIASADEPTIELFLREYLAAEGSVNTALRRVEFITASPVMAEQLNLMLRRLGVWASKRQKLKAATNGSGIKRAYWENTISGPSLRILRDRVGIANPEKACRLEQVCANASNPNRDTVPMRDLMVELADVTRLSRTHFGVTSCYMRGQRDVSLDKGTAILDAVGTVADGTAEALYREQPRPGRGGHRYVASTLEAFSAIDRDELATLQGRMRARLEREVLYAKVVAVEDVWLDEDVYDFEVAGTHNYVAAGVLCHNTQTTKTLVQMLTDNGKRVKLCAPTGKAARRMQELTGHAATTIHRLLEFSPQDGGFQRDETNPIEADCVILDEASMLALDLAHDFFRAIGENTHVLLVGDPDQLAPVGAGKVLDDLITTEAVPRIHLQRIFRQSAKSMIVQNARRINTGQFPYMRKEEAEAALGQQMDDDFFWVTRKTPEETAELVLDLAVSKLPRAFDLDPVKDIMVLAPMRDGKVGLHYLNAEMEKRLNTDAAGQPKKPIISRKYKLSGKDVFENICVGSRIVQTKNDYTPQREIMNGELGIVLEHDEEKKQCLLSLDDGLREVWVPVPDMDTFFLAWALTTHKSQGSEFKAVVCPVSTAHFNMLNRALYYTAVTRAKQRCVMVGEKKALAIAVKNPDMKKRNSTLAARITKPELSGELF